MCVACLLFLFCRLGEGREIRERIRVSDDAAARVKDECAVLAVFQDGPQPAVEKRVKHLQAGFSLLRECIRHCAYLAQGSSRKVVRNDVEVACIGRRVVRHNHKEPPCFETMSPCIRQAS